MHVQIEIVCVCVCLWEREREKKRGYVFQQIQRNLFWPEGRTQTRLLAQTCLQLLFLRDHQPSYNLQVRTHSLTHTHTHTHTRTHTPFSALWPGHAFFSLFSANHFQAPFTFFTTRTQKKEKRQKTKKAKNNFHINAKAQQRLVELFIAHGFLQHFLDNL